MPPQPKSGKALRDALAKIAGDNPVDRLAAERYASQEFDQAEVSRLARSKSPTDRQTAGLRAAAMLAALDMKAASKPKATRRSD